MTETETRPIFFAIRTLDALNLNEPEFSQGSDSFFGSHEGEKMRSTSASLLLPAGCSDSGGRLERNSFKLFQRVARHTSCESIAASLGLHMGTIRRWMEQQKVPSHYTHDFLRMLGEDVCEAGVIGGSARSKDQYYTRPEVAESCLASFHAVAKELGVSLGRYQFIEPAAGCGWFYRLLPKGRRIGIDIDPRTDSRIAGESLVHADFLTWAPRHRGKKYVVVGNPPFGLRGHLALQFINHSWQFADMVGFILPQLFDSDGKGVPGKRVVGYRLAHTERLPLDSFAYPDGTPVKISTVFQVWTKVNTGKIKMKPRETCGSYIRVYSLSDGGTPSSTRNRKMIGRCDVYLPSTCFSGMRAYGRFEDLPNQRGYGVVILREKVKIKKILFGHDWRRTAFLSTNSALNLRSSLIEDVVVANGCRD